MRKVTVELPGDLLRRAQKYRALRRLKGNVTLSIDLDTLRVDQK